MSKERRNRRERSRKETNVKRKMGCLAKKNGKEQGTQSLRYGSHRGRSKG